MDNLETNETHALRLEWMGKQNGGWWLELINRSTGHVKIMMSDRKSMFEGVTIAHALRWTNRDEWKPMYKANKI